VSRDEISIRQLLFHCNGDDDDVAHDELFIFPKKEDDFQFYAYFKKKVAVSLTLQNK
jgi:hypothetical protein